MVVAVAVVLLFCVTVCLGWLLMRQLATNGRRLIHIEMLEQQLTRLIERREVERGTGIALTGFLSGSALPDFSFPMLDGGQLTRSDSLGRPLLLIFVMPDEPYSRQALETLARDIDALQNKGTVTVILSTGTASENRAFARATGIRCPIVMQQGWEAGRLMAVSAVPAAYAADRNHRTVAALAAGRDAVIRLTRDLVRGDESGSPPGIDWTPVETRIGAAPTTYDAVDNQPAV